MNVAASGTGGIGLAGLLTIVFVILKLTGVINWSWWWVVSPLLITWGLSIALLAVVGVAALVFATIMRR